METRSCEPQNSAATAPLVPLSRSQRATISNKEARVKRTICPTAPDTSPGPPWLVTILMDLFEHSCRADLVTFPALRFSLSIAGIRFRGVYYFYFLTLLTHGKPRRKIPLRFQGRGISLKHVCHTANVLHELIIEGAYVDLFTRTGWIVIKSALGTCFLPWSALHQDCFNCGRRNHQEAVPNASTCCKWLGPRSTLQRGPGTSANSCHYLRHTCQSRASLSAPVCSSKGPLSVFLAPADCCAPGI